MISRIRFTKVVRGIVFIIFWGVLNSSAEAQAEKISANTTKTKERISSTQDTRKIHNVRMVSFFLKDGKMVSGREITVDSNKITVAELINSHIVVNTYSTREIDIKSRTVRVIPEIDYYEELAVYFASRTGDFRDDPDDFIQAIRFYEKARNVLIEADRGDSPKADEIQRKIAALQADRQVWVRETQDRAELRKLEIQATLNDRIQLLQEENDKSKDYLEKLAAELKILRQDILLLSRDISLSMSRLEEETISNRREMDELWRRRSASYFYGSPALQYPPRIYYQPGTQNNSRGQKLQDSQNLPKNQTNTPKPEI